ncbi:MAG TPA: aldo/keto reductase [archaeon]|nr:aldo/keto reductase [archaeon]
MKTIDRRRFLQQALVGAGVLAAPWAQPLEMVLGETGKKLSAADRVTLGRTGITATRLAIGSGTRGTYKSSNQTKLGKDKFVGIIRHGFERGITFWDMADNYGSHPLYREALKYIPRDKVVILTKSFTRDAEGMQKDIERFRVELGSDMLDILLLHCLTDDNWTEKMKATMDVVSEAREKGILRAYGVSCHSLGALKAAAGNPWAEVILARINHAGVLMDAAPEAVIPVLRQAYENGKSILGMKIVGEGRLKDQIDLSLNFVLGQGFFDAITVGFESTGELDEMMKKIELVRV